jgi:alkanesulfonate monooxygenase SsuD/methylene tetrahydromethanopterin reductase-like flavin-dependent oxidoreductase (luciferase family)
MGKDPDWFPNAIATMYFYIAEERRKAEQVVRDVLGHLRRPGEKLGERFLTGAVEQCAERLAAYQAAGAQRVFLWPIADELNQITIFQEKVAPLVRS